MPEIATWLLKIPEAVDSIAASQQEWYGRQEIEVLLALKPRRAQQVLAVAGAKMDGKAFLVSRENLIAYLQAVGAEVLTKERARRARFSQKLSEERERFQKESRLMVGIGDQDLKTIKRAGFKSLPEGILLEPGKITISGFTSVEGALKLLGALAIIAGRDMEGFERRITL